MPGDRRHARIAAMQALCQWDVQRDASSNWTPEFMLELEVSAKVARRASANVKAFLDRQAEIDRRISACSPKWSLARMSPVIRNVMRVAVVEWLGGDVPPKVALNEALEIVREYADEDAVRFVNGILDSALKRLTADSENDENDDGSDGRGNDGDRKGDDVDSGDRQDGDREDDA